VLILSLTIQVFNSKSTDNSCARQFSIRQPGVTHVLVTGGAGYIGSHAALRVLKDSFRVTIVVYICPHSFASLLRLAQIQHH